MADVRGPRDVSQALLSPREPTGTEKRVPGTPEWGPRHKVGQPQSSAPGTNLLRAFVPKDTRSQCIGKPGPRETGTGEEKTAPGNMESKNRGTGGGEQETGTGKRGQQGTGEPGRPGTGEPGNGNRRNREPGEPGTGKERRGKGRRSKATRSGGPCPGGRVAPLCPLVYLIPG